MPAGVVSIDRGRRCQFSILELALPGHPVTAAGIFLLDPAGHELHFKLRDDWESLGADEGDEEYLEALADDFDLRIRELGAEAFLESLEDSLSGLLRISDREPVAVSNASRTLQRLYDNYVDSQVREYVTHLPLYSLKAAATKFGEDAEVEERDWIRAPEGLRLTEGMFVAQVVGRSMEPLIPDGSHCIFRAPVVGSRQGKRLLIQEIKATGSSSAFTVKRYTSRKKASSEEEWHHEAIRLEPLNPEFEAFELAPDVFESRYRVIAEFVQALDED
ncbi:MAG TPA: S24 family peptidase [Bryobacteraceae bacterium]|jgi:phage repressor protein C with HTH and peptisase S24 domain